MKKVLIIFSITICFVDYNYSQSGWTWQNPLPQGNTLEKVFFLNDSTVFICGFGTILKSSNAGTNWFFTNCQVEKNLSSFSFINQMTGFASGENLIKSTDGGYNWIFVSSEIGVCNFINENTGFLARSVSYPPPTNSAGNIAKTTNGGNTWISSTFPISMWLNCISFYDNVGIAGGMGFDGAIILRTTNMGLTWIYIDTFSGGDIQFIQFISNNIILASAYTSTNGLILKSTNSGINWSVISNNLPKQIFQICFINENTGFLAGEYGQILKTTDGGFNWLTYNTGFTSAMKGIGINSTGKGIVCGTRGIIYSTSNYGESWFSGYRRLTEKNIIRTVFINRYTGYVLADSSNLLKTTNAGANWELIQISNEFTMKDISFVNMNVGIAVGLYGTIFFTSNGGTNWQSQNSGTTNHLNSAFMIDSNYAYTCYYNNIVKTTNGGVNWFIKNSGYSDNIIDIYFF